MTTADRSLLLTGATGFVGGAVRPALERAGWHVRCLTRNAARARDRAPALDCEPAIDWAQGDVLALPYDDGSFDAATVGFGVRNVADLRAALLELRRVVRPGGRLAILEITQPRGILRPFFSLWFDRIVPLLGRVLPGGKAYTYLPASVRRFPGAEELARLIDETGFEGARFRLFGGSIVALHTATAQ